MAEKFVDLRAETLDEIEKEGLEHLYKMMFTLRQQKNIRNSFDNERSGVKNENFNK